MAVRLGLILLLPIGLVSAADAPSAVQPKVGVASVVERKAEAAQNGVVRTLILRDALFRNERLTTGAEPGSLLHVRLLDKTVITLGPSSEAVLDDFALNPAAGRTEVNLKLTRGVLRFVGGQHAGAGTRYQVRTPVATIGVRGTSFDVKVGDGGETTVQLEEGELLFENDDGMEVVLDEPMESSSIGDDDDAPSEPEIDESLAAEFDTLDLSEEQLAEDSEIAGELEDEELEPIDGEDPDDEPAGEDESLDDETDAGDEEDDSILDSLENSDARDSGDASESEAADDNEDDGPGNDGDREDFRDDETGDDDASDIDAGDAAATNADPSDASANEEAASNDAAADRDAEEDEEEDEDDAFGDDED